MGFAVIHMMKIGKGGLRGIQSHNQRERESRSNPDIDKDRSKDNYELMGSGNKNYTQEVNQRIELFASKTKTVRKDAVVLCNFIITSDEQTMKALSPSQQKGYFEDAVTFLSQRYGAEMVVNATVHMDETTPHLHVGIVPITEDGRLSAKSIFTRTELQSLQTDFAKEVGAKYGLERGVEGSERTHLSEQRFKTEQAKEQAQKAQISVFKAQKALEGIKDSLIPLKAEYEAKKAYLEQSAKDSDLSTMYPSYAKVTEKGVIKKEKYVTVPAEQWEQKHVSANEHHAIIRMREAVEQSIEQIKQSKLAEENKLLREKNERLERENRYLRNDLSTAQRDIRAVNQFFQQNPAVKQAFAEERAMQMQTMQNQQVR